MSSNFQYIPFNIPQYLYCYLAFQLNGKIESHVSGGFYIEVDRYSLFGKHIHASIEACEHKPSYSPTILYLKISNWAGNNYKTAQGRRHFLALSENAINKLQENVKNDFNESMIQFVNGAEFAHASNGWSKEQKRKGIRTAAITEFCDMHNVTFDQKNFESFIKMIQRASVPKKKEAVRIEKKFVQSLSY